MGDEEVEMLGMVDAPRKARPGEERTISEGGVWSQWGLPEDGRMFYSEWLFQSQLCIPRIFMSSITCFN